MAGLRRATVASFVLLVVQYAIGTGVNLYVGVPSGVRGIGDVYSLVRHGGASICLRPASTALC